MESKRDAKRPPSLHLTLQNGPDYVDLDDLLLVVDRVGIPIPPERWTTIVLSPRASALDKPKPLRELVPELLDSAFHFFVFTHAQDHPTPAHVAKRWSDRIARHGRALLAEFGQSDLGNTEFDESTFNLMWPPLVVHGGEREEGYDDDDLNVLAERVFGRRLPSAFEIPRRACWAVVLLMEAARETALWDSAWAKRGRHVSASEAYLTQRLVEAFELLVGRAGTISTDAHSGKKGGPAIEFMKALTAIAADKLDRVARNDTGGLSLGKVRVGSPLHTSAGPIVESLRHLANSPTAFANRLAQLKRRPGRPAGRPRREESSRAAPIRKPRK